MSMILGFTSGWMGVVAADTRITTTETYTDGTTRTRRSDAFQKLRRLPGGFAAVCGRAQPGEQLLDQLVEVEASDLEGVRQAVSAFPGVEPHDGLPGVSVLVLGSDESGVFVLNADTEGKSEVVCDGCKVRVPKGLSDQEQVEMLDWLQGEPVKGPVDLFQAVAGVFSWASERTPYISDLVDMGFVLTPDTGLGLQLELHGKAERVFQASDEELWSMVEEVGGE